MSEKPIKSAIALKYDGTGAPKVMAKGHGELAEILLAIAKEHNVPLYNEPALSALLSEVKLGREIPEDLYLAVAEVIAFVYRCGGGANLK